MKQDLLFSKLSQELRSLLPHRPTPWANMHLHTFEARKLLFHKVSQEPTRLFLHTCPHFRPRSNPHPYLGEVTKHLSSIPGQDAIHTLPTPWKFIKKLNTFNQTSQDQWHIFKIFYKLFFICKRRHKEFEVFWLQHTL